jgi:hypothetical protein
LPLSLAEAEGICTDSILPFIDARGKFLEVSSLMVVWYGKVVAEEALALINLIFRIYFYTVH